METYEQFGITFCKAHHTPTTMRLRGRCPQCVKEIEIDDFEKRIRGMMSMHNGEKITESLVRRIQEDYIELFNGLYERNGMCPTGPGDRVHLHLEIGAKRICNLGHVHDDNPSALVLSVYHAKKRDKKGKPIPIRTSRELYDLIIGSVFS